MTFNVVELVLMIFYVIIFIFGTVGNVLVVKWFMVKKQREKAGNTLVVALAINDFISSVIVPLWQIHHIVRNSLTPPGAWYIGKGLCHFLPGIAMTFLIATSFLLVSISLERFRLVLNNLIHVFISTYYPNYCPKISAIWKVQISKFPYLDTFYQLPPPGCG